MQSGMQSGTQGQQIPHDKIAMRAYEKWCRRGRTHGHHQQDWLEAEQEIRNEIARGQGSSPSGRR
jgi:hypothetical protein